VGVALRFPSLLLFGESWSLGLGGLVVSVGVSSVGLINGNWVRSIDVLGLNLHKSVCWLTGPLFSSWVWVVWNVTSGLNVSCVSNRGFKGVGSVGIGGVS